MTGLDRFCAFARIDVQDDAGVLTGLLAAAERLVCEKTGKARPPDGDPVYDLAVMMLAAHWYDNRTPAGDDVREIPYTVTALLGHIALCGKYKEAGHEPDE